MVPDRPTPGGTRHSVDRPRIPIRIGAVLWSALIGGLVALVVIGFWTWRNRNGTTSGSTDERLSVAVLPLRNLSPDPADSDYLAEGITQAVITRLTRTGIRVTPWETARTFRDSRVPADQLARQLNVSAVLVGTFQVQGNRLLTTLSLVDAASGLQSWTDEFEESYEDLFGVQRRIAVGVATSLSRELTSGEVAALETPEARSVEAWDAYLQGALLMEQDREDTAALALQYFEHALELDPTLADAQVGIGAVHDSRQFNGWGDGRANLEAARAAYESALRLDPASMRARRGLIRIFLALGQSESALMQGREAARLGRSDAVETLLARGDAFAFAGLDDLAMPLYRRALELDPGNQAAHWGLAVTAHYAGSQTLAIEVGKAYLDLYGDDPDLVTNTAIAYELRGDDVQARAYHGRAVAPFVEVEHSAQPATTWSGITSLLAAGAYYSRRGEQERARTIWQSGIARLTATIEQHPSNIRTRLFLATFYGMQGDRAGLEREATLALSLDPEANPWELTYLAGAYAAVGDVARAVDLLRTQLRRGRLPNWRPMLHRLAPALAATSEFQAVQREYEAMAARLRARYGPAETAGAIAARPTRRP